MSRVESMVEPLRLGRSTLSRIDPVTARPAARERNKQLVQHRQLYTSSCWGSRFRGHVDTSTPLMTFCFKVGYVCDDQNLFFIR